MSGNKYMYLVCFPDILHNNFVLFEGLRYVYNISMG